MVKSIIMQILCHPGLPDVLSLAIINELRLDVNKVLLYWIAGVLQVTEDEKGVPRAEGKRNCALATRYEE